MPIYMQDREPGPEIYCWIQYDSSDVEMMRDRGTWLDSRPWYLIPKGLEINANVCKISRCISDGCRCLARAQKSKRSIQR
jgi:hypothetical protein